MQRYWHDRLSLRIKATVVVLIVTILALSIVTVAGVVQMRRLIAMEERRTIEAIAQGVGHAAELALAVRDEQELSRLADRFLRNDQILFVAIYDESQKLVAHRVRSDGAWDAYVQNKPDDHDFILGRQDVNVAGADEFAADASGIGRTTEGNSTGRAQTGRVGTVIVALSTAPARFVQQQQGRVTAASTAFAAIISIVLTCVSVGAWTRRLNGLVTATASISKGDFANPIRERRRDEIGRLARAYERMRRALRDREMELREFNDTLQEQVTQRTCSLEEALHAAEAADRAKSLFLANMSHEIRTPLNGVVGMIDLLRGTRLDEHQQHFAQVARSSADALLSVINDILDFSKIEAGRLELESTGFDLPTVIEDLAETAAVAAARKGLELSCFVHPQVPDHVVGDPARLGQVLMNLTNNAIKFTEKGQVVVRVGMDDETASHAIVRVTVTDSGIGIPADRTARLFRSFSQIDASTTRKYGGTGLGLAISKKLAEMMGGTIGVESELGRGSTFWFTLRLEKAAEPQGTQMVGPALAGVQRLRVIAVDDSEVNREILQQQLSAWKLEVATAPDGPTAMKMLHEARSAGRPFGLAVLDWHMPGMDGIDLAKAIRAADGISQTPLVMLTSVEDRLKVEELKDVGFAGYLVKPVRQSRLLDTIAQAVGRITTNPSFPAPSSATLQAPTGPHGSREAHLLVAEDNEINRMVAGEVLKHAGYTCDMVDNGKSAFQDVFAKSYDLVLMDCQMPGTDGFEATRAIREKEQELASTGKARHIHIIALTANAIKGDRELCLSAGMDDYVTKPIDPARLVEAIERGLATRKVTAKEGTSSDLHPSETAVAPVDVPSLLTRCMGNAKLAENVLARFETQVAQELEKLKQTLAGGDIQRLTRIAHAVKGTAANVSAEPVRHLAAELERLGREGDLQAAEEKLEALRSEVERCVAFLQQRKAPVAAPEARA